MHARPEGEVPVGGAAGIEAIGCWKLCRVAVGRTDTDVQVGAGRQPLAADLEVGRQPTIAELVGRGLVAGVQQEDAVLDQLVMAEPLAVDLAMDERAQHIMVVGRPLAPGRDKFVQVGRELCYGSIADDLPLRTGDGLQRSQDGQRIAPEGRALTGRHTQHVANDFDRKLEGKILDQVHPVIVGMSGDQPVDDGFDPGLQSRQCARRKGGG